MKRTNTVQKWILIVWMMLLCYPLFEFLTPINSSGKLSGGGQPMVIEPFTTETWFDGTFQESFLNYMNEEIGLFPFFIRLHNQVEYTLFKNIHTRGVVAGKNNYLFEKAYIKTYYGKDYLGKERITRFGGVMEELQDSLESKGKFLMYAFAMGKATYYPEYIPYKEEQDTTNKEMFLKEFDERGVNYLDFAPGFLSMKDTMGHLLFPQYGIHWSHYTTILATDTLIKYIEHQTGWDLPNLTITSRETSPVTKYNDNDIAKSMNLFNKLQPDQPMVYPEFEWDKPKKTNKKLLVISDSFFWDMFEYLRLKECFDEVDFWYYYQTVVDKSIEEGRDDRDLPYLTRHMDLLKTVDEYDAFIILSNEPNTLYRGWGFPKDLLETLKDSSYVPVERGNEFLEKNFIRKKEFTEALTKLAKERGITLEEMIDIYMHDRNFKLD